MRVKAVSMALHLDRACPAIERPMEIIEKKSDVIETDVEELMDGKKRRRKTAEK